MRLRISLLLIAAVTITATNLTKEDIKRELLDGNFGQKTSELNKTEESTTTPAPENKNVDESETKNLQEQSVAEQFFGTRMLPVTKISDLLTGQGLPFHVALANQLYAPMSVYNARQPVSDEPSKTEAMIKVSPKLKTNNLLKVPLQEKSQIYVADHLKKTLNRHPGLRLPGVLGPEFYTQETRYPPTLSKYVLPTPDPRLYLYKGQPDLNPYLPVQYYQHQQVAQIAPEERKDYENQEGSQEDKGSLLKTLLASRAGKQYRPGVQLQGYHAHPHGAVSYSRFHHDQALPVTQLHLQRLYKQPFQFQPHTNKAEFRRQEDLHVPQPPAARHLSQEQKFISPGYSQQAKGILQDNFSPSKPLFVKILKSQFNSDPHQNLQPFYLQPIGKPFSLVQSTSKSLEYQQSLSQSLPKTESNFELPIQTNNITKQEDDSVSLSESKQSVLSIETKPKASIDAEDEQRVHLVIPGTAAETSPHSVIPLNARPGISEPQLTITSKTLYEQDSQPTTLQPDVLSDTTRDVTTKHLTKELQEVQPTSQTWLASPTLQSLSALHPSIPEYYFSPTPLPNLPTQTHSNHQVVNQITPYNQVQIQQQDLDEIHSELAPVRPVNYQQQTQTIPQNEQHPAETLPNYQPTTQEPSEPKPDYEIEIASNVDHSQLPKDLQPVMGPHETNDLAENQSKGTQSFLHFNKKPTRPGQVRPHAVLQTFGEPPSYHNINYHDPNSLFLYPGFSPPAYNPQIIQPRLFSQPPGFPLHHRTHQSPIQPFPPVQYFGNFAESIFGGF